MRSRLLERGEEKAISSFPTISISCSPVDSLIKQIKPFCHKHLELNGAHLTEAT